jgi:Lon protease-like protein
MSEKDKIPLFPLTVVLLPETPLPLHIFEERYKEMINECLKNNSEFGIVYTSASTMQTSGCTAQVERVIHTYDDGRLDIQIRGVKRFKIMEVSEERSFLQAEVEFFDDDATDFEPNLKELAEEGLALIKKLQAITQRDEFIEDLERMNFKSLSYYFGVAYGFTVEEKQHFLELRSTAERLEKTVDGLRKVVKRVRMLKAIEKASLENKKKYGFSIN